MSADRQRLEYLAVTTGPRVLSYLARRIPIAADAADVYQEVLLVAWRRIDRVPADDNEALAWMFGTARRCLANHRRGANRRMAATERLRALVQVEPSAEARDEQVQMALSRLGNHDRELLTLVYWDELTCEQAAAVLSIKPAAARKRLERARQRMRRELGGDDLAALVSVTA